MQSVLALQEEWLKYSETCVGTLLCGDLNVHHERWLQHSTGTTPQGTELYRFCCEYGFEERVRQPTRGNHLLDLVLTDQEDVSCEVLPGVSDHQLVAATLVLHLPKEETVPRQV